MNKPGMVCIYLFLSLVLSGCRHVSRQENPDWPSPGPVDLSSLPAIGDVINHGTADPDKFMSQKKAPAASPSPQTNNSASHSAASAQPIMLGSLKEQPELKTAGSAPAAENAQPITDSPPPSPVVAEPPAPPPAAAELPPPAESSAPAPENPAPPVLQPKDAGDSQSMNAGSLPSSQVASAAILPPVDSKVSRTSNELPKPTSESGIKTTESKLDSSQFGLGFDGLPVTAVSAGRVAARVGKEVITVYDLNMAIQDWMKANLPQGQAVPERERIMMARMVLFQMIDRMLIVQEANRMMKSEKQKEALLKQIDSVWEDQQIPPMMKKYKVETKYDLDQALRKQGRSIDAAKKDFINDALAHEFMGMKLGSKTYVSLTEMRRYYNEHLTNFDQPAQLTWREIRIPIEKGKETEADTQVLKIIDELKQRSDFATLAKRDSKGPTADQGGLWETSPGGFAVPDVNQALENMQAGHVVGPIKAQSNYHIVKMESKRAAGPARFDEVQTQIQEKLRQEKLAAASMGFIQDLRKNTLIWTIFDATQTPNSGDNQVQQAQMQPQSLPPGSAPEHSLPAASAQSQPALTGSSPVASGQAQPMQGSGLKGVKIGAGGKELHFDLKNRQVSETDPPPAIAPSGPIPPAGVMSGPSQPSPL